MATAERIANSWNNLTGKVNAFTLRERGILLGMVNTVTFIILFAFMIEPNYIKVADLKKETQTLENDAEIRAGEFKILKLERSVDPNSEIKARIEHLQTAIEEMNKVIKGMTSELIPAEDMVNVLTDLLSQQTSLVLVQMNNLAGTPVALGVEEADLTEDEVDEEGEVDEGAASSGPSSLGEAIIKNDVLAATMNAVLNTGSSEEESGSPSLNANPADDTLLYSHGVNMVLQGEFWDIVDYIKLIESMKWKFFWHLIDYQVLEYPRATVVLELRTLGYDRGWLGI